MGVGGWGGVVSLQLPPQPTKLEIDEVVASLLEACSHHYPDEEQAGDNAHQIIRPGSI